MTQAGKRSVIRWDFAIQHLPALDQTGAESHPARMARIRRFGDEIEGTSLQFRQASPEWKGNRVWTPGMLSLLQIVDRYETIAALQRPRHGDARTASAGRSLEPGSERTDTVH